MIGTRLGAYEIVEEIGKGGFATVYRAYQPSAKRFVAIKVIHRAMATEETGLERFQQEAELVTRLEHPFILPVYDVDMTHDPPFIVMRYLEGGTLKDILDRDSTIPLGEIAHLTKQIAAALDYAHRRGVIHRDIKPSNVMIDPEGNTYLMDFGIARFEQGEALTRTGLTVGTPVYMAPEQGMGEMVDARTDIYALGVMVFEMATGQLPFEGENPFTTILKHVQEPVPSAIELNDDLPDGFEGIMQKALAKQPEDRYQTATELAEDLTNLVGASSVNRIPEQLKTGAIQSLQKLQDRRAENQDEIDTILATFAAQRTPSSRQEVISSPTGVDAGQLSRFTNPGSNRGRLIGGGLVLALIVAAGLLLFPRLTGSGADPTITPTEPPPTTQVVAQLATETPLNTITATIEPTVSLTNVPATDRPTATDAPSTPILQARREVVVLSRPENQATTLTTIESSDSLVVLGYSEDEQWYQVALPNGEVGWVTASSVMTRLVGDADILPTVPNPTPLATSTPRPTQTPSPTDTETPSLTPTDTPTHTPTATQTNTPLPTDTATPTLTDTHTPSNTPIPSDTPTNTPTHTVTPSDTPTLTPSDTPTTTPTNTLTPSLTPTPSDTPSLTPTNTPTPTSTLIPSDTPTLTPSNTPTPTPIPVGRLPYVVDFETDDALEGWSFNPDVWSIQPFNGQNVLFAQGGIEDPLIMYGNESPQWLDASATDFVLRFRVNINSAEGARVLFRYQEDVGYNLLEVVPGSIRLKRSGALVNPFNLSETEIARSNAPIQIDAWEEITIWAEGTRIYVYVNNDLLLEAEDLNIPQLSSGQIWFQTQNAFRTLQLDDIAVQLPEVSSTHFDEGSVPTTWVIDNPSNVKTEFYTGNQALEVNAPVTLRPRMNLLGDMEFRARMWSVGGGYTILVRDSVAGSVSLTFDQGHLQIENRDASGILYQNNVRNVYGRGNWQDLYIAYIGDRLEVWVNGQRKFEDTIANSPTEGGVVVQAVGSDIFRIDDVLVTEAIASSNAPAAFAYVLESRVNNREFRNGQSDFLDDFSQADVSQIYWKGGSLAIGDLIVDPNATEHQNFLRIAHLGLPTWRLFEPSRGVALFGAGLDTTTYRDATDVRATVLVRFPLQVAGEAWLGVRVVPDAEISDLYGYRLGLRRNDDGTLSALVTYRDAIVQEVYYEGPIPNTDVASLSDWIPLKVISFQEKLAFFVNDEFITMVDNALSLGGSVGLGVEVNTVADFDEFEVRDTTPLAGD